MSEFHDPDLRQQLGDLSGPFPDDNVAFAAWQRRVGTGQATTCRGMDHRRSDVADRRHGRGRRTAAADRALAGPEPVVGDQRRADHHDDDRRPPRRVSRRPPNRRQPPRPHRPPPWHLRPPSPPPSKPCRSCRSRRTRRWPRGPATAARRGAAAQLPRHRTNPASDHRDVQLGRRQHHRSPNRIPADGRRVRPRARVPRQGGQPLRSQGRSDVPVEATKRSRSRSRWSTESCSTASPRTPTTTRARCPKTRPVAAMTATATPVLAVAATVDMARTAGAAAATAGADLRRSAEIDGR